MSVVNLLSSSQLGAGSDPAAGDPLRLFLRLVHHRQQLDARVLQLVIDHHVIKELPVLSLHLLGCCFHLLEVFVLRVEAPTRGQCKSAASPNPSCDVYPEGPVDIVAGGDGGRFSGLSEALQRWWLHVDDEGLQVVSPHRLDGLTHTQTHTPFTFNHLRALAAVQSFPRWVTMTTALRCAYVWLDVNDADLPAGQNISDGLDAGAVQIPFVLTVFQKPAEGNRTPALVQDEGEPLEALRLNQGGLMVWLRPLTWSCRSCCQRPPCW